MNIETKQDVLERILANDKPACPHCKKEMILWEVPDIAVGDGLGWGTPYLYVCFNDECPSYVSGWKEMQENYAHTASCRCINFPGSSNYEFIPVFSSEGGKGQMIDDTVLAEQEKIREQIKIGFSLLAGFYVSQDWFEVLKLLIDPIQPGKVRLKAAEMVGDIGDVDVIEELVNHKFPNKVLTNAVEKAVAKLHERHFTKFCPFCAEIIKRKAVICKHCNRDM